MNQADTRANEQMAQELKDSGLTPTTVAALKCVAGKDAGWEHGNCYRIPYFDSHGAPIPHARWKLISGRNGQKYTQPHGSKVELYLPPLLDWLDPGPLVCITEGEKKAAAVSQLGIPCVGLPGVYSFAAKNSKARLHPVLQGLAKGRSFVILFDSDYEENKQVVGAAMRLSELLHAAGALDVREAHTPPDGDRKLGVDDWLADHPLKQRSAVLLAHIEENGACYRPSVVELAEMNKRWCLSMSDGLIYDIDPTSDAYGSSFRMHTWLAGHGKQEGEVMFEGKRGVRSVALAKHWLNSWEKANVAEEAVFLPTQAPGIVSYTRGATVNLYNHALRLEPVRFTKKGVAPFLDVLDNVLLGNSDEHAFHRQWLLDWLAYPLQHRGAKLAQGVFVWGPQGAGKSALSALMTQLYLPYAKKIEGAVLGRDFNKELQGLLWADIDEMHAVSPKQAREKLNTWIADDILPIVGKGDTPISAPNHTQFWLTSNHQGAYPVDSMAVVRRVFHLHARRTFEHDWWQRNFFNPAMPAQVLDYLLRHPISDQFDPKGPAPQTGSLAEAQLDTGPPITRYLQRIQLDWAEHKATRGCSDFVTIPELVRFFKYEDDVPQGWSSPRVSDAMRNSDQLPVGLAGKRELWCMDPSRREALESERDSVVQKMALSERGSAPKRCSKCVQVKPVSEFHWADPEKTRLLSWCKPCQKGKK